MKNLIATIKKNLGIEVNDIKYYEGGVSNDNFLINNQYIYRRKKEFSQPFYNPECEKEIEEFLKDKNITVPLVCVNNDGTKITKFVKDSKDLSSVEINDELLIKIAKKLKELHSYKHKALSDFKPFERISYYLESNQNPKRDIFEFITKKMLKYYENEELIMCHNDLVPGNILITKDNEVKILDFEYASNNHPFFDIISFLSENNITDENKIKLFINTYYENKLPENIKEMTEDFYNFLDLLWYNWACMMYVNLHEPIYHQIAKIKALRLTKIDITK